VTAAPAQKTTSQGTARDQRTGYAVDIVGVSKRFQRSTRAKGYGTIKSALLGIFQRPVVDPATVTHAVRDITLRIPRGASVGVIGRNGSGKSTLLKLITGIYKPDAGQIRINGRVAALIELGAGFHPDFTGRENLYLAGVMLGLTRKEIDDRFDDMVAFAELAHVIDDPVRTYSSGMFMRLGFSVAVHTDPEVLLVDEVLAVGDAAFVAKCKDRISALRREGKTLFLVSHDLDAVERWCDEALWLHEGEVRDRGEPRRVIDAYRQFVERGEEESIRAAAAVAATPPLEASPAEAAGSAESNEPARWGSREVEVLEVALRGARNEEHRLFHPDDPFTIEIRYRVNESVPDCVFGICITRADGVAILGTNTDLERVELPPIGAPGSEGTVRYSMKRLGLLEGSFSVDVAAHRVDGYPFDYRKGAISFAVRWPERQLGVYLPERTWSHEVNPVSKDSAPVRRGA
jgi:ABC-type polysaccharide/polyol phosphate transport system ATPase subunit